MPLEQHEDDLMRCTRCSYCKWVPHQVMADSRFLTVCPSIERFKFHAWSAGGRLISALSLLRGRTGHTDTFVDVVYQCQMCGACDVSCKVERDLEPYEVMQDLRTRCVEEGALLAPHIAAIEGLKQQDNMLGQPKESRGKWAEGCGGKDLSREHAEVLFHAGCRYSYDEDLWQTARDGLALLQHAGVDVGTLGREENCCGGRSYEMGYSGELTKYAQHNLDTWRTAGIKTVVTACADCYQAFKVLYDKNGNAPPVEILHITELIDRLIGQGRIKMAREVPLTVTYHDPCHLGRLAEPWVRWEGKRAKVRGQLLIHDPPRKKRCGAGGVYDAPRAVLRAVPGLRLVEMVRIREYAWCCGAGGGVAEAYPEFATWTAGQRLEEARAVGAEALVSACGWCKRSFLDAAAETGREMKIYDIIELVRQAL
ncbi:MAG: (Fe-S)-binding protein [bacterium]